MSSSVRRKPFRNGASDRLEILRGSSEYSGASVCLIWCGVDNWWCTKFHRNRTSRFETADDARSPVGYRLYWASFFRRRNFLVLYRNMSGFRASSAVSKRLDGFLSNLVGHWMPVVLRFTPNFVPIRSAVRFRPFASNLLCRRIVSSCVVRMPFANASRYPHEITQAEAA